jgi:tetratricopeptide (TPR) repeat protein
MQGMSSDPILEHSGRSAGPEGDADQPLERASTLCQLCRYTEAQTVLSEMIAVEPRNADAWSLMARAQLGQEQPLAALHAARAAISITPTDDWAVRLASAALGELGRHDEAVEAAEEAVRLAPRDWRAQAQLAEALTPTKPRLGEATAAAGRALELAPEEARSHIAVGLVAEADGRPRDAAKAFVRALALDPRNGAAHSNLERVRQSPRKRFRLLPRLSLRITPSARRRAAGS